MSYKADNAIIMAAGTSSRFAPISFERPKGLIPVLGEVLVERQIRQLREAGIQNIILVTGYKHECFDYLKDRYQVTLVHNPFYDTRNNNSSIYMVRSYLRNSYICSSDNYFTVNPFESEVDESYYATVFSEGKTDEWCISEDKAGYIDHVSIGGQHSWYMMGHAFWDENFSRTFCRILEEEYDRPETAAKLWENIYMEHLDVLKMRARHYENSSVFEFDTLDELRSFDPGYIRDSHSKIMKEISHQLHCGEEDMTHLETCKSKGNSAIGFSFYALGQRYQYSYQTQQLSKICDL